MPKKQKDIIFTHIETDEEIPPGTREMVEEIYAENLFQMWLKEQSSKAAKDPAPEQHKSD